MTNCLSMTEKTPKVYICPQGFFLAYYHLFNTQSVAIAIWNLVKPYDVCSQAMEAEVNVFYPELTARDSSFNLLVNQLRRLQVSKSLPSGVGQGRHS